jgi:hypothetical protein
MFPLAAMTLYIVRDSDVSKKVRHYYAEILCRDLLKNF